MGDFRSMDPIFKGCYGDLFLYSDVDLGQLQHQGYTFPLIGVRFLPHQFLPTCRPNSLRLQSGPHHGPRCPLWQPNLQRPSNPAGRVGNTTVQDVAQIHKLRNALTLPQPRSLLAPRSKSRRKRTSPPRVMALTNVAGPPLHLLSQMDVSRRKPTQKTPANSTPPSPLAPVGLMASAVRQGPTVRQLSSNLLPSLQPLSGLVPHDNGNPYWKKVSAH